VSDLLFLYACTTREVAQLREIAATLGLTVQAASHTFRGLARRGLAELRGGRYRPTVAGVDFLHGTLVDLDTDLARRIERLHIVARTRAVARAPIAAGAAVLLTVEDGFLTARPGGSGPSRGVARAAARSGELVEVERLSGIVPLRPANVELLTIPEQGLTQPGALRALAVAFGRRPGALLAAQGLEAYHLASRAARGRNIGRFGIAAMAEEASRLGVPCAVVVLDRDAPQLLAQFDASGTLRVELVPLTRPPGRRRAG